MQVASVSAEKIIIYEDEWEISIKTARTMQIIETRE